MLDAGYKIAVCDQVEEPAQARGLVRREVTRVVTPGTVSDLEMLDQVRPNYLAGVRFEGESGAGAFLDVSTGEFFVRRWPDAVDAVEDLERLAPREILTCAADFKVGGGDPDGHVAAWIGRAPTPHTEVDEAGTPRPASAERLLRRQFGVENLRGFGLVEGEAAVSAAALVLDYARRAADPVSTMSLPSRYSRTIGAWCLTRRRCATWRSSATSSIRPAGPWSTCWT